MTRKISRRRQHLSSKEARKLLLNVETLPKSEKEHRAAALVRLSELSRQIGFEANIHMAQVHACEAILRNTSTL